MTKTVNQKYVDELYKAVREVSTRHGVSQPEAVKALKCMQRGLKTTADWWVDDEGDEEDDGVVPSGPLIEAPALEAFLNQLQQDGTEQPCKRRNGRYYPNPECPNGCGDACIEAAVWVAP